jgi:hypothetical protein
MAGFLGWFRPDKPGANVPAALACLRHHASFRTRVLVGDARAGAGVVYRESDPPEVFEDPERQLVVAILGAVLEHWSAGWHRFTASELAMRYAERGVRAVSGLDGFYQLLIWDGRAGRLHLWNDRVGTMPAQHATVAGATAFAPEAKALFRLLPLKPRMDFTGMVSFLNLGYPVGTCTLFEGVRLLAPAYRLTLDLHTGGRELERTWVQRFEPDKRLGLRAAVDMLYAALLEAHQAPLGREGERVQIALTGGYDSRLVLAVLHRLGRLPAEALTWGATDAVPSSDVTVARELAGLAGVPHRFLRYSAERVPVNAREWVMVSELASDNAGFFAAGPRFLEEAGVPIGTVYLGEHVIGPGGAPRTVDEAIQTVVRVPARGLLGPLEGILRPEGRTQVSRLLWQELDAVAAQCTSRHPKDVQDHLFLHCDAFRWLFAPAFYKEPMCTVRRPLFLGPVMDVVARLPEAYRVDKRVLVALLQQHLPQFAGPAPAAADSLVDWEYDSRTSGDFRVFLEEHTRPEALTCLPWDGTLEPDSARALIDAFFAKQPLPLNRQAGSARFWVDWRRELMGVPVLGAALRWVQPALRNWKSPRVRAAGRPFKLIWRLALLQLLHECLESGAFEASGTTADQEQVESSRAALHVATAQESHGD